MRRPLVSFAALLAACLATVPLPGQDEAKAAPPPLPAQLGVFPKAMYAARADLDAELKLTAEQREAVARAAEAELRALAEAEAAGEAAGAGDAEAAAALAQARTRAAAAIRDALAPLLDPAQRATVVRIAEVHRHALAQVTLELARRRGRPQDAQDPVFQARVASLVEKDPRPLVPACRALLAELESDAELERELGRLSADQASGRDAPKEGAAQAGTSRPQPPAKGDSFLDGVLRAAAEPLAQAAAEKAAKAAARKGRKDDARGALARETTEAATRALLEELLRGARGR
ncbi:MAG: hypothetical protein IT458_04550 [Planctomycetes bacterium]|nr:hypothetical protein [Planctomycetota bacterium]